MFCVTITASAFMTVLSGMVLLALRINKDSTEAASWIKRALRINVAALLMILVTYSIVRVHEAMSGNGYQSISYKILNISEMALAPSCMCFVSYLAALVFHKPEVERIANRAKRCMCVLGVIQCSVIIVHTVRQLMGACGPVCSKVAVVSDAVVILLLIILICRVIYSARRELGTLRLICFSVYVLGQTVASWISMATDETLFYSVSSGFYIFMLLVMQTERINMSNLEAVQKSLLQENELNHRLQESIETIERDRFLLKEISNIYVSLHVINVKNNTYRELGTVPDKAAEIIRGVLAKAGNQKLIWAIMKRVTAPAYVVEALRFTDFDTLNERMRGRKVITFEAIDDENQWFRFSFIRVGENLNDDIEEVIYTSENIDRDKREKERLSHVSYIDELTGVSNRNAYIEETEKYRENGIPDHLRVLVTDINGLKQINDTKGHRAGDELIIAAAECLRSVCGREGQIYRTGGDEFITVFTAGESEFETLQQRLEMRRSEWKGKYANEIRFSTGCVCSDEYPGITFEGLVKEADKRMYADKKEFYRIHKEYERRKTS